MNGFAQRAPGRASSSRKNMLLDAHKFTNETHLFSANSAFSALRPICAGKETAYRHFHKYMLRLKPMLPSALCVMFSQRARKNVFIKIQQKLKLLNLKRG